MLEVTYYKHKYCNKTNIAEISTNLIRSLYCSILGFFEWKNSALHTVHDYYIYMNT